MLSSPHSRVVRWAIWSMVGCAAALLAWRHMVVTTVPTAARPAAPFDVPLWAFPQPTAHTPPRPDHPFTGPWGGGDFAARRRFDGPYPPMPASIAHGRPPVVPACGFCHYADGSGAPENAMLAGLSPAYILAQVADFRSGARRSAWAPYIPGDMMVRVADSATAPEVQDAIEYFAKLKPRRMVQVVERAQIPRPRNIGGRYALDPRGGTEPLGVRLLDVELEDGPPAAGVRHVRYVTWVPLGSIARGRALATMGRTVGAAVTPACTSCHGPELRGVGDVPPLAGRFPSYLLRQLLAFRTDTRRAPAAAPMRAVAATLSLEDMIAAAAYAATLNP